MDKVCRSLPLTKVDLSKAISSDNSVRNNVYNSQRIVVKCTRRHLFLSDQIDRASSWWEYKISTNVIQLTQIGLLLKISWAHDLEHRWASARVKPSLITPLFMNKQLTTHSESHIASYSTTLWLVPECHCMCFPILTQLRRDQYSQWWPQPVGQQRFFANHSWMCGRCPPWPQPWHQANRPRTVVWLKSK